MKKDGPYTKEDAERVLSQHPNMPKEHAAFWLAIANNKQAEYCLKELKRYKGYSDELPNELITFEHGDNYKCRANSIIGMSMAIYGAIEQKVIKDEDTIKKIKDLAEHKFNALRGGHKGQFMTTPEEIEILNSMLDVAIDYIQETYKLK